MLEEAKAGGNAPDTGVMPGPKGSRRPAGAPTRENLENRLREGKRKTAATAAGAPSTLAWSAVNWKQIQAEVWRLQVRIAEAVRKGRWGKVRSLQRLLVRSRAAKLWAVRRVTTNKGKRTPGVDGVIWRGARQKLAAVEDLGRRGYSPQPLRRLYIPKKNQKLRPLSIPTMKDRAMQALYLLALSPIAETVADPNSYGFRLRRSVADAWAQCFIALARSYAPQWVFEGDIESCFDRISHPWLLENIPMDREILRKWLEAGYIENATFHQTLAGTPQGGVISPVIANLALDGLEGVARDAAPRVDRTTRPKVNVIRYADDFIITAASKELLLERVIPAAKEFLAARGLRLSEEKSKITRVCDGFEFLGADVRRHGRKLLIRPAKRSLVGFLRGLRAFLREQRGTAPWKIIQELNRRIRGWVNFYRPLVSSRAFRKLDSALFRSLWRWVCTQHPNKRSGWLKAKYFCQAGKRSWAFSAKVPSTNGQRALFPELVGSRLTLLSASSVSIRRHVKVRAEANPFDPSYDAYFHRRLRTPRTIVLGAVA